MNTTGVRRPSRGTVSQSLLRGCLTADSQPGRLQRRAWGETAQQQGYHGPLDHIFRGGAGALEVLARAAIAADPSEGSLDGPASNEAATRLGLIR